MSIFDVVKDVAKVGVEILPIVLDNMATGTQSKQTVPLGSTRTIVCQSLNFPIFFNSSAFDGAIYIKVKIEIITKFLIMDMG